MPASSPTADWGKSPTSGAWCQWFLQKSLDLTRWICVKRHTRGPISPTGCKSWSALVLVDFNRVAPGQSRTLLAPLNDSSPTGIMQPGVVGCQQGTSEDSQLVRAGAL